MTLHYAHVKPKLVEVELDIVIHGKELYFIKRINKYKHPDKGN